MSFFSSLKLNKSSKNAMVSELMLDGRALSVLLRENARAKRMVLRMNKTGNGIIITLPPRTSKSKAMEFAASHGHWINRQLAKQIQSIEFKPGEKIPIRGTLHQIFSNNERRTPVWIESAQNGEHQLFVSGDCEHHARRITDWLKKQARADLSAAAHKYAKQMDVKIARISIRDTSSRWGSCSSAGALSFSWRLIFAPDFVLDYVAAHEVAHLIEMNHSAAFWQLVNHHCQQTEQAKKWLKQHGRSLHKYGLLTK